MTEIEKLFLTRNQVHILYSHSPITFLFPVIFAVLLYFLLQEIASATAILYWTAGIIVFSIVRYIVLWLYKIQEVSAENVHLWLYLFVVLAFVSGLLWGIAPAVLIPYQPGNLVVYTLHNSLVLLLICGLVAGAGIAYSVNLLVICAYSAPILLLPSIYLVLLGDKYNTVLGGFMFLYFVFVNISVLRLNRQFRHYLQIEYRYELLAAENKKLAKKPENA